MQFRILWNIAENDQNGKICDTNVDTDASADLLINDRIRSSIKVSLNEYLKNSSIIHGSKASIIINSPWLPNKKTFLEISNNEGYYKNGAWNDDINPI